LKSLENNLFSIKSKKKKSSAVSNVFTRDLVNEASSLYEEDEDEISNDENANDEEDYYQDDNVENYDDEENSDEDNEDEEEDPFGHEEENTTNF